MKARRSYSVKNIRHNYTYTPEEIGELFGIAASTIFRWIREEGLKRIEAGKKYHIHSTDLIIFLKRKSKKHKVKCEDNQFYCMRCRSASNAKENSLRVIKLPNKTVRVSALCMVCGSKINKAVSASKYNENHPLFISSDGVNNTLNTVHDQPLECNS